jgi:hypothetical protein
MSPIAARTVIALTLLLASATTTTAWEFQQMATTASYDLSNADPCWQRGDVNADGQIVADELPRSPATFEQPFGTASSRNTAFLPLATPTGSLSVLDFVEVVTFNFPEFGIILDDNGDVIATFVDLDDLHPFRLRTGRMISHSYDEETGTRTDVYRLADWHDHSTWQRVAVGRELTFHDSSTRAGDALLQNATWEFGGHAIQDFSLARLKFYLNDVHEVDFDSKARNQLLGPYAGGRYSISHRRWSLDCRAIATVAYGLLDAVQGAGLEPAADPQGLNTPIFVSPFRKVQSYSERRWVPLLEMDAMLRYQAARSWTVFTGVSLFEQGEVLRASNDTLTEREPSAPADASRRSSTWFAGVEWRR